MRGGVFVAWGLLATGLFVQADRKCVDDRYGEKCEWVCGHCRGGAPCDDESGFCPNAECEEGWLEDKCDTETTGQTRYKTVKFDTRIQTNGSFEITITGWAKRDDVFAAIPCFPWKTCSTEDARTEIATHVSYMAAHMQMIAAILHWRRNDVLQYNHKRHINDQRKGLKSRMKQIQDLQKKSSKTTCQTNLISTDEYLKEAISDWATIKFNPITWLEKKLKCSVVSECHKQNIRRAVDSLTSKNKKSAVEMYKWLDPQEQQVITDDTNRYITTHLTATSQHISRAKIRNLLLNLSEKYKSLIIAKSYLSRWLDIAKRWMSKSSGYVNTEINERHFIGSVENKVEEMLQDSTVSVNDIAEKLKNWLKVYGNKQKSKREVTQRTKSRNRRSASAEKYNVDTTKMAQEQRLSRRSGRSSGTKVRRYVISSSSSSSSRRISLQTKHIVCMSVDEIKNALPSATWIKDPTKYLRELKQLYQTQLLQEANWSQRKDNQINKLIGEVVNLSQKSDSAELREKMRNEIETWIESKVDPYNCAMAWISETLGVFSLTSAKERARINEKFKEHLRSSGANSYSEKPIWVKWFIENEMKMLNQSIDNAISSISVTAEYINGTLLQKLFLSLFEKHENARVTLQIVDFFLKFVERYVQNHNGTITNEMAETLQTNLYQKLLNLEKGGSLNMTLTSTFTSRSTKLVKQNKGSSSNNNINVNYHVNNFKTWLGKFSITPSQFDHFVEMCTLKVQEYLTSGRNIQQKLRKWQKDTIENKIKQIRFERMNGEFKTYFYSDIRQISDLIPSFNQHIITILNRNLEISPTELRNELKLWISNEFSKAIILHFKETQWGKYISGNDTNVSRSDISKYVMTLVNKTVNGVLIKYNNNITWKSMEQQLDVWVKIRLIDDIANSMPEWLVKSKSMYPFLKHTDSFIEEFRDWLNGTVQIDEIMQREKLRVKIETWLTAKDIVMMNVEVREWLKEWARYFGHGPFRVTLKKESLGVIRGFETMMQKDRIKILALKMYLKETVETNMKWLLTYTNTTQFTDFINSLNDTQTDIHDVIRDIQAWIRQEITKKVNTWIDTIEHQHSSLNRTNFDIYLKQLIQNNFTYNYHELLKVLHEWISQHRHEKTEIVTNTRDNEDTIYRQIAELKTWLSKFTLTQSQISRFVDMYNDTIRTYIMYNTNSNITHKLMEWRKDTIENEIKRIRSERIVDEFEEYFNSDIKQISALMRPFTGNITTILTYDLEISMTDLRDEVKRWMSNEFAKAIIYHFEETRSGNAISDVDMNVLKSDLVQYIVSLLSKNKPIKKETIIQWVKHESEKDTDTEIKTRVSVATFTLRTFVKNPKIDTINENISNYIAKILREKKAKSEEEKNNKITVYIHTQITDAVIERIDKWIKPLVQTMIDYSFINTSDSTFVIRLHKEITSLLTEYNYNITRETIERQLTVWLKIEERNIIEREYTTLLTKWTHNFHYKINGDDLTRGIDVIVNKLTKKQIYKTKVTEELKLWVFTTGLTTWIDKEFDSVYNYISKDNVITLIKEMVSRGYNSITEIIPLLKRRLIENIAITIPEWLNKSEYDYPFIKLTDSFIEKFRNWLTVQKYINTELKLKIETWLKDQVEFIMNAEVKEWLKQFASQFGYGTYSDTIEQEILTIIKTFKDTKQIDDIKIRILKHFLKETVETHMEWLLTYTTKQKFIGYIDRLKDTQRSTQDFIREIRAWIKTQITGKITPWINTLSNDYIQDRGLVMDYLEELIKDNFKQTFTNLKTRIMRQIEEAFDSRTIVSKKIDTILSNELRNQISTTYINNMTTEYQETHLGMHNHVLIHHAVTAIVSESTYLWVKKCVQKNTNQFSFINLTDSFKDEYYKRIKTILEENTYIIKWKQLKQQIMSWLNMKQVDNMKSKFKIWLTDLSAKFDFQVDNDKLENVISSIINTFKTLDTIKKDVKNWVLKSYLKETVETNMKWLLTYTDKLNFIEYIDNLNNNQMDMQDLVREIHKWIRKQITKKVNAWIDISGNEYLFEYRDDILKYVKELPIENFKDNYTNLQRKLDGLIGQKTVIKALTAILSEQLSTATRENITNLIEKYTREKDGMTKVEILKLVIFDVAKERIFLRITYLVQRNTTNFMFINTNDLKKDEVYGKVKDILENKRYKNNWIQIQGEMLNWLNIKEKVKMEKQVKEWLTELRIKFSDRIRGDKKDSNVYNNILQLIKGYRTSKKQKEEIKIKIFKLYVKYMLNSDMKWFLTYMTNVDSFTRYISNLNGDNSDIRVFIRNIQTWIRIQITAKITTWINAKENDYRYINQEKLLTYLNETLQKNIKYNYTDLTNMLELWITQTSGEKTRKVIPTATTAIHDDKTVIAETTTIHDDKTTTIPTTTTTIHDDNTTTVPTTTPTIRGDKTTTVPTTTTTIHDDNIPTVPTTTTTIPDDNIPKVTVAINTILGDKLSGEVSVQYISNLIKRCMLEKRGMNQDVILHEVVFYIVQEKTYMWASQYVHDHSSQFMFIGISDSLKSKYYVWINRILRELTKDINWGQLKNKISVWLNTEERRVKDGFRNWLNKMTRVFGDGSNGAEIDADNFFKEVKKIRLEDSKLKRQVITNRALVITVTRKTYSWTRQIILEKPIQFRFIDDRTYFKHELGGLINTILAESPYKTDWNQMKKRILKWLKIKENEMLKKEVEIWLRKWSNEFCCKMNNERLQKEVRSIVRKLSGNFTGLRKGEIQIMVFRYYMTTNIKYGVEGNFVLYINDLKLHNIRDVVEAARKWIREQVTNTIGQWINSLKSTYSYLRADTNRQSIDEYVDELIPKVFVTRPDELKVMLIAWVNKEQEKWNFIMIYYIRWLNELLESTGFKTYLSMTDQFKEKFQVEVGRYQLLRRLHDKIKKKLYSWLISERNNVVTKWISDTVDTVRQVNVRNSGMSRSDLVEYMTNLMKKKFNSNGIPINFPAMKKYLQDELSRKISPTPKVVTNPAPGNSLLDKLKNKVGGDNFGQGINFGEAFGTGFGNSKNWFDSKDGESNVKTPKKNPFFFR